MSELTVLLERLNRGDEAAFDELVPLVYQELRAKAQRYLTGRQAGHTLQPTALVHEAFLKLVGQGSGWETSRHFYNAAAEVMRQILVSHARAKHADKRGGNMRRVDLEAATIDDAASDLDYEALDSALRELKAMDARRHQVVMLRFFAGLTDAQIAQALSVSEKTIERDWATAKLFLRARMREPAE